MRLSSLGQDTESSTRELRFGSHNSHDTVKASVTRVRERMLKKGEKEATVTNDS